MAVEYDFMELGPYAESTLNEGEVALLTARGQQGWELAGVAQIETHASGVYRRRYYFTRSKTVTIPGLEKS